jgi:putative membrane protein
METNFRSRALLLSAALACSSTLVACASQQKSAPSAEEVRDGEALPPAPPAPAEAASPNPTTAPGAQPVTQAERAPAQETLTTGQLARLSELVNTAEIEQAKLAQARSRSPTIKKFAAMMLEHHGKALREQQALVKKLDVTPADSSVAASLKADAEKTLDTLKKVDAASFDASYAKSQIDGHQQVLDVLDKYAPATPTPELADRLSKARAFVAQHLQEAQALASK